MTPVMVRTFGVVECGEVTLHDPRVKSVSAWRIRVFG